jgi:predicted nucleic acid-binding protein
LQVFLRCDQAGAFCAAHSLAEIYSTLTRLPPPHRATAQQAALFLDSVCERLSTVSLNAGEYRDVIRQASLSGVTGSAIYDYLIFRCALKVNADPLYTWNLRHYTDLVPSFRRLSRLRHELLSV